MHTHALTHVCTQVPPTNVVFNTASLGPASLSQEDRELLGEPGELKCWAPGINKRTKKKKGSKKTQTNRKKQKTQASARTKTHMHTCIFLVVSDGTSYVISYGSLWCLFWNLSGAEGCWAKRWWQSDGARERWEGQSAHRHTHIHFLWHDGIYEMSFLWIVLRSYGYMMSFLEYLSSSRLMTPMSLHKTSGGKSIACTREPTPKASKRQSRGDRTRRGISVSLSFMCFLVSYFLAVYGCLRHLLASMS